MNNKSILGILFTGVVLLSSCCLDICGNTDIMIVNGTADSLYFYVHSYKSESDYTYNFAYDSTAARKINANEYNIAYNINNQKILPNDTVHPFTPGSWKAQATKDGGLTVLFYKRNIQRLAKNAPLSDSDIFRRIDLTTRQLDSFKYTIVLK